MSDQSNEVTVRELRSGLADVIHEVTTRGKVMFVTNRNRRVVAIVPVPAGEAIEAAKESE